MPTLTNLRHASWGNPIQGAYKKYLGLVNPFYIRCNFLLTRVPLRQTNMARPNESYFGEPKRLLWVVPSLVVPSPVVTSLVVTRSHLPQGKLCSHCIVSQLDHTPLKAYMFMVPIIPFEAWELKLMQLAEEICGRAEQRTPGIKHSRISNYLQIQTLPNHLPNCKSSIRGFQRPSLKWAQQCTCFAPFCTL